MKAYARTRQGWELPPELGSAQQSWDLDDGALLLAGELATLVPELGGAERRALHFLLTAVLLHQRRGSTRLPLEDGGTGAGALDRLLEDLGASEEDRRGVRRLLVAGAAADGPLSPILGAPGDFKPLILDGGQLYIQRMYRAEQALIAALRARMAPRQEAPPGAGQLEIDDAVEEVVKAPPTVEGGRIELSDEQRAAVELALRGGWTVITGGPGTGKTSIVVSILRALVRLGLPPPRIALAAPTGKAANRMAESIQRYLEAIEEPPPADRALIEARLEPRTLHRLLAWSPSRARFRHDEADPLEEEVVIVDEASMIDLILMERLLGAVRPDARLILLGDAEQLPSVDAGAVLRELVPSDDPADPRARFCARLTESFRMKSDDPAGKNILEVSGAINRGRVEWRGEAAAPRGSEGPDEAIRVVLEVGDLRFRGVELLEAQGAAALDGFLERWWEEIAGLEGFEAAVREVYRWEGEAFAADQLGGLERLFRHFEAMRLLCVTRGAGAPTGAQAVNEALHQRALLRHGQRDLALLPGEPVMMQRNDYARGLFNGDQGLILRVQEPGEIGHRFRAVFRRGGGFAIFPLEGLRGQLGLSYAMTVHKSQGSEFDRVGLILPEVPIPLLSREILYTAITRSRRGVAVVGRREVFAAGVERRLERHSGIGEGLLSPGESGR